MARAVSARTTYAIILPIILGVFVVGLAIYLVFWNKKRKIQAKKERPQARRESIKTWGRDMGDPISYGKGKQGGERLLRAS
jgi:hypothetical protein